MKVLCVILSVRSCENMSCDLVSCREEGSTPYLIPVGGSNTVGTWGYIEAFREMVDQVRES